MSKANITIKDTLQGTVTFCGKDTAQFRCLWIIQDYEDVKNKMKKNEFIVCTDTVHVFEQTTILQLCLYPKGDSNSSGNDSSLYLQEAGSGNKVWVQFRFALLDGEKYQQKYANQSNVEPINSAGMGYKNCFPIEFPNEESITLFPNGCLQIICEGTVWANEPPKKKKDGVQLNKGSNVMSVPDLYYIDSGRPFDSEITVAGVTKFPAYKTFLCSKSAVFQRMFSNAAGSSITIPNVTVEVFREILNFLYANTITAKIETMLPEVIKFAHEYELAYLHEICEIKMMKKLSVENALDYYRVAREINATWLKDKSMDFIVNNGSDISSQESFRKFKSDNPDVGELLERLMITNKSVVTM